VSTVINTFLGQTLADIRSSPAKSRVSHFCDIFRETNENLFI